ncbi:hypothetical protein CT19431_120051 [Cupriavidus taiwanensis]|nr:hypothetical protein CT19431_120051 [Cupriavidus taiwanensis]
MNLPPECCSVPPKNEQPYYFWTIVRMYGIGKEPIRSCTAVLSSRCCRRGRNSAEVHAPDSWAQ